jgi:hypothetical protein
LENSIDNAAEILGKAMITNSGLGLNWPDAYIGQLIGLPPHFGIGISGGFTAISMDELKGIFDQFGIETSSSSFLPIPAAAGEIRIGGFFLPFDIGIKALPLPNIPVGEMEVGYKMAGGDFRYALMQDKGWTPAISIGIGLTYTSARLTTSLGKETDVDLSALGQSSVLKIPAPDLDFSMKNTTLDFKIQVSKKLLVITPYLGLGVSYGWYTIDFGVNSKIYDSISGVGSLDQAIIDAIANEYDISLDGTGLEKTVKYSGLGLRVQLQEFCPNQSGKREIPGTAPVPRTRAQARKRRVRNSLARITTEFCRRQNSSMNVLTSLFDLDRTPASGRHGYVEPGFGYAYSQPGGDKIFGKARPVQFGNPFFHRGCFGADGIGRNGKAGIFFRRGWKNIRRRGFWPPRLGFVGADGFPHFQAVEKAAFPFSPGNLHGGALRFFPPGLFREGGNFRCLLRTPAQGGKGLFLGFFQGKLPAVNGNVFFRFRANLP